MSPPASRAGVSHHLPSPSQMFVRLFVDENLDRMVPISKQPKEKIQAIIESCSRQFPEFQERARKRIRTYLKSCRRMKKNGMEMVSGHPLPCRSPPLQGSRSLSTFSACVPADQAHATAPDLSHGGEHPGRRLRERNTESGQEDAAGDLPDLPGRCLRLGQDEGWSQQGPTVAWGEAEPSLSSFQKPF